MAWVPRNHEATLGHILPYIQGKAISGQCSSGTGCPWELSEPPEQTQPLYRAPTLHFQPGAQEGPKVLTNQATRALLGSLGEAGEQRELAHLYLPEVEKLHVKNIFSCGTE